MNEKKIGPNPFDFKDSAHFLCQSQESAESIDFEGLKDAVAKAVLRAVDVVTEVVRD